jgi:DNA-binding PucR family transcriptional regulator
MTAACIAPIVEERDGAALLETLRAFYAAGRNRAKAGNMLGADRHTIERHLRRIETLTSCTLHTSHAKVELALRLHELWQYDDRAY